MNDRPLRQLVRPIALGAALGVACGAASALFLWSLERATSFREHHEGLVYALPVTGLVIGAFYERFGASVARGTGLVLDTIHDAGPQIPSRMGPMVLVGTVLTHLFGGSAGREGTAVQMGGAIADFLAHRLTADRALRRQLVVAGIAGGFGSVFGTPVAGAIFALELPHRGRLEHDAIGPALAASFVGDLVTRRLGVAHSNYPTVQVVPLGPLLLAKWVGFGLLVALVTVAFVALTHRLRDLGVARLKRLPLRMLAGGATVVILWKIGGTSDYLGLGVPTILRAFSDPSLAPTAFAWKLVFTAVTLGAGFLGGEVTPLFFVGAALGNAYARAAGLPIGLGAAVGLASVFGAAAKTPIALTVMVVELCGAAVFPHAFVAVVVAYLASGEWGIYGAQKKRTQPG